MDNQQKNNFNEKEQNIDEKYSRIDLEFLRQIGEIAREFQTEYNALKSNEQESSYQRSK